MHRLTRHLRGPLVAAAALALSGGAVLAARPTVVDAPPAVADPGLRRASEASGKTLPARPDAVAPAPADGDGAHDVDDEAPEPVDEAEAAADAEPVTGEGERPQNHGWFVSEAAKGATPTGFDHHGQYVSEIAGGDDGKPEAATAAADRGGAAEAAKARKAEKPTKGDRVAKAGKN